VPAQQQPDLGGAKLIIKSPVPMPTAYAHSPCIIVLQPANGSLAYTRPTNHVHRVDSVKQQLNYLFIASRGFFVYNMKHTVSRPT